MAAPRQVWDTTICANTHRNLSEAWARLKALSIRLEGADYARLVALVEASGQHQQTQATLSHTLRGLDSFLEIQGGYLARMRLFDQIQPGWRRVNLGGASLSNESSPDYEPAWQRQSSSAGSSWSQTFQIYSGGPTEWPVAVSYGAVSSPGSWPMTNTNNWTQRVTYGTTG